ncbi:leucine-rich repeat transmembrane neuronal protein 3-like [Uranotaenia lowii]|uniref:leucine-rich repeat transmembrane neuronal protein 3-like n=1 Tax=Uranotaenia lowii TaxID=190385 RepID=UPI002479B7D9|nr:leucine-rich repeat transmembrane neuronal protein 3-like [Uranotaenia lowii]
MTTQQIAALLLLFTCFALVIPPSSPTTTSAVLKLGCDIEDRVCYLRNVYASEGDRFKNMEGSEGADVIEFFDCHIHTLPRIPYIKRVRATGIKLVRILEKTFATVVHLDVSSNRLREFSAGAFEWPEEVQSLNIGGNPLLRDVSVVMKLIELLDLQMPDMKLDLELVDKNIFSGMKNLKTLNLSNNKIVTVPVGIFNRLESLELLDLSNNYITRINAGSMVIIYEPYSLRKRSLTISLSKNNISIIENNSFMVVKNVDLSDNKLIGIGPTAFNNGSELEILTLSGNRQLRNFNFLKPLGTLHTLTMSNMNFTFAGIPLDVFRGQDNLASLDLSHNDIETLPIGIFSDLSSVNYINLRYNRISHVEFGTFSIRKYDLIDEIDLSYNELSDLNYLVFVPLKYLRVLLLHGNQIPYVNADQLKRSRSLQNFGIQNNPISCSDLVDLLGVYKLVLDGQEFVAHEPNVNGIRCNPSDRLV